MHIVLIGDSIFDNAPYVMRGATVSDQLSEFAKDARVTLLAVDGDVTTDVENQLLALPSSATQQFVSCGGNDALQCLPVLHQTVKSVGEAMDVFREVTESFRRNYRAMLSSILSRNENLTVCTIYNCISNLPERIKQHFLFSTKSFSKKRFGKTCPSWRSMMNAANFAALGIPVIDCTPDQFADLIAACLSSQDLQL